MSVGLKRERVGADIVTAVSILATFKYPKGGLYPRGGPMGGLIVKHLIGLCTGHVTGLNQVMADYKNAA